MAPVQCRSKISGDGALVSICPKRLGILSSELCAGRRTRSRMSGRPRHRSPWRWSRGRPKKSVSTTSYGNGSTSSWTRKTRTKAHAPCVPAHSRDSELPKALLLQGSQLYKEFMVRIGQVRAWTPKARVVANFPAMAPGSVPDIMEQVAYAFRSPSHSVPDHKPDLVLLPEVSIPQPEVRTVRNLVASTGRAALAGLYWRELRPVYRACYGTVAVRKWFVNEAELVVPFGHDDRGPPSYRWYRVRKPLPAHNETGLAQALTAQSPGTTWSILRGYRWYRFVHRRWGDFTIFHLCGSDRHRSVEVDARRVASSVHGCLQQGCRSL